jgi:hypothetical protein
VALADANVFHFVPRPHVPWLPIAMLGALAAALFATRTPVLSQVLQQPDALWRLTVPQSFRVVGIVFLIAMVPNQLPLIFTLPAGLGDIALGVEAVFVAPICSAGAPLES